MAGPDDPFGGDRMPGLQGAWEVGSPVHAAHKKAVRTLCGASTRRGVRRRAGVMPRSLLECKRCLKASERLYERYYRP